MDGIFMNHKAFLSIVVTAFNQHHAFENLMASIFVQTEKNPSIPVEVVIVDNGSAPKLETIIETNQVNFPIRVIYRDFCERNFRPSSAKNIGIGTAIGEFILLIDGDCILGPSCLRDHWELLSTSTDPIVTLGHRIFIDGKDVDPSIIRKYYCDLHHIPEIASASNNGFLGDRRLVEFENFDCHPMPFNCCHGCNLGIRRVDFNNVKGFDESFDGYWGYEDIEFGHRMWGQGARIVYLHSAYVYHQETTESLSRSRVFESRRNYELVCERIPGFKEFRDSLNRPRFN